MVIGAAAASERPYVMPAVRRFISFGGVAALLAVSGCIVPMSGPPKVQLPGRKEPVSVTAVAVEGTSKGVVYAGLTRAEIRQRLAGLPLQRVGPRSGLPQRDVFGPFEKEITHLYVAAWHGSHSWGFYRVPCSYVITVSYDSNDLAQECWCSEGWRR
jgi:hypothetical protein